MESTNKENNSAGETLDEKAVSLLQEVATRLAVMESKHEALHDTSREILAEQKKTNGRVYTVEAEVAGLTKRADSHSVEIKALKESERTVLVAGWKLALSIITGAGAVSAAVAAFVGYIKH